MVSIPFVLAASGLFTLSVAAPIPLVRLDSISTRTSSTYSPFGGDGTPRQGWPKQKDWISTYDEMFDNNDWIMKVSCSQWNVPDNSDDEIAVLKKSISKVADDSGIDSRYILAVVLQESNGCVRAPTTANGVTNPGLMQSHHGKGSCNRNGQVQNPCPEEQIVQMIRDGVEGTGHGNGLKALIEKSGGNDVSKFYKASRMYNSGSIAASANLGDGNGSTACYSSDVANRLIGWSSDPSPCNPKEIISVVGVGGDEGDVDEVVEEANVPAPETPAPETPAPETPAPPVGESPAPETPESPISLPPVFAEQPPVEETETPAPEPISEPPVGDGVPVNIYPGATQDCSEYHLVVENDYCDVVNEKFGITLDDLTKWNEGLKSDCMNLWLGYSYCIKA